MLPNAEEKRAILLGDGKRDRSSGGSSSGVFTNDKRVGFGERASSSQALESKVTASAWGAPSNARSEAQLPFACTPRYLRGVGYLLFVTTVYGAYSPMVRYMFVECAFPPPVFIWNAGVAVTGLVVASLYRASRVDRVPLTARGLRAGFELGLYCALAATFNVLGLVYTTAMQGAFCDMTSILVVPLIQRAQGVPVPLHLWVAAALCGLGTYLLIMDAGDDDGQSSSDEGAGDAATTQASAMLGDALCFLSAIFYSLFDVRMDSMSQRVDYYNLAYARIIWYAVVSVALICVPFVYDKDHWGYVMDYLLTAPRQSFYVALGVMLWQGVVMQFLSVLVLVHGLAILGPTRAQILYSFSPLLSAAAAWVVLGETLGAEGVAGAVVLLSALLAASYTPPEVARARALSLERPRLPSRMAGGVYQWWDPRVLPVPEDSGAVALTVMSGQEAVAWL